jgi:uncharacterized repeat protein (TIGR03803 family)
MAYHQSDNESENHTPLDSYLGNRRNRIMDSKRRLTIPVSVIYFRFAFGALSILSLVSAANTLRAQNAPAESVVYSFATATGAYPTGVVRDAVGNLYVGTEEGGSNQNCADGCGSILKVRPSGKATVLYSFIVAPPYKSPDPSGLVRDALGDLYGETGYGGSNHLGSVFELGSSGAEKTLYNFTGGNDGSYPAGGVTMDSAGNLYGTTEFGGGTGCGGGGCGVVYKVTHSGRETVLYSFTGGTDGAYPEASPILDATGNLYGTAAGGGNLTCFQGQGEGCGTVWKLDTSGNQSVLYTFMGGTDGAAPAAGLVMDPSGNLYGNTFEGGNLSCFAPYGCGTVFELSTSGNLTVLYSFTGSSSDGASPFATLLRDSAGNLYGTTVEGGDQSCIHNGILGCGVVFKLDISDNETILHAFAGGTTDGAVPVGALISDGKGNLYGATAYDGLASGGVIFAVRAQ